MPRALLLQRYLFTNLCLQDQRISVKKLQRFCCSADALAPDKSSVASDKLKELLRLEGVLDLLVQAALHHATLQDQAVASSDTDNAVDR